MSKDANMPRTVKYQGKTIYRRCSCGETAHDLACTSTENGGSFAYKCRNCNNVRGLCVFPALRDGL